MELWKSIPGFEGIYEVSNMGRIRSKEGKTTHSVLHGECHWKQRIIKQHYLKRKSGTNLDARITLWKDKKPHYYLVSRLVAKAWVSGYCEGMTVNHKDGDPLNNCADNLEWVSLHENILHAFENGLYSNQIACTLISENGRKHYFRSQSQASLFLGHNHGYINLCIKRNRNAMDRQGRVYSILSA